MAPGQIASQKGDLDGPQARPPGDATIDNFRFHPDYHVDLILWRRIIGQVTDAIYVKPTVAVGPFGSATHAIAFEAVKKHGGRISAANRPGGGLIGRGEAYRSQTGVCHQ